MKTILVQVESGPAAEARLRCALDIARASGAHLTCLVVSRGALARHGTEYAVVAGRS